MELTLATEEEKRLRDRLTFAPWGSPISLQDWFRREDRLRAHPWSRRAMRTWLLRGDRGEVLSSCETFDMPSLHRQGALEDRGTSCGVASVFTEERLRGRGHAAELLRRLHARAPDRHAFILFSEVGAGIYERAGYAARPGWNEDLAFPPSDAGGPGAAEVVPEEELGALVARLGAPEGEGFFVTATPDQFDWHRERERIYAEALGHARAPGCGARHPEGAAVWTGNLRSRRLYVLQLEAETAGAADALLEAARRAAFAAGLGAVHLWKRPMPEGWSAERAAGRLVPRDQALPMIHPLRPGLRADAWNDVPRVLWV